MCYVRLDPNEIPARGRELNAAEWIRLGEQAVDAETLFLTITGGEPLMHPQFPEIYEALTEMGFFITLQTNLSLLDGKLMDLIAERPPRAIKSTLYGATEETYEKVCGVKNGLQMVRRGIENVKHAKIPLVLVSTVIRENQEELNAIHQLAADYGFPLAHTHNVMNTRRNGNGQNILSSRILFEDLTEKEKKEARIKPHQIIRTPLDGCGNYKNGGYWILWNGHLSLCAHMDLDYTPLNITGEGKPEGITSCFHRMLDDLDRKYPVGCCDSCEASQYCSTCPAVLYADNTVPGEGKCLTAQRMMECAQSEF